MQLKIDREFESKIPPLTAEEFRQLEENIVTDGVVINPIITWNGIIVDGHNRFHILERHPEIKYTTPQGGLFLWLTFPDGIDALDLFNQMKDTIKVIFVPGNTFYPYGGHPNTARISFATVSEEEIETGITRMGAMLTDLLHK